MKYFIGSLYLIVFIATAPLGFGQIIDSIKPNGNEGFIAHHKVKGKPGMLKVTFEEKEHEGKFCQGKMTISGVETKFSTDLYGHLIVRNFPAGAFNITFDFTEYCKNTILNVKAFNDKPTYLSVELWKKSQQSDTCSYTRECRKNEMEGVSTKSICTESKKK